MVNWVAKSPHFSWFDSLLFFINSEMWKQVFGNETRKISTKIVVKFQDIGWLGDDSYEFKGMFIIRSSTSNWRLGHQKTTINKKKNGLWKPRKVNIKLIGRMNTIFSDSSSSHYPLNKSHDFSHASKIFRHWKWMVSWLVGFMAYRPLLVN